MPEEVVAGPQCSGPGGLGSSAQLGQLGQRIGVRTAPVDRLGPGRNGVLYEGRQDESDGPKGLGWSCRCHTAWYPRALGDGAIVGLASACLRP